jgi:class 3 adenylate cyclase/tetratricopeptide (TPR) repeat protein
MRCSSCHYENPQATRFCGNCGTALNNRCARCGRENPPQFNFCGECGAPLQAGALAPAQTVGGAATSTATHCAEQPSVQTHDTPGDERKTVTAMFADIKGSTELMEDLDPEEARAIIDPALNLMIDAVHRYDGYIVQSTGDGIFALFGAPVAHEDHPQRALYAALRMQEELRRYSVKLREAGNLAVEARVGVNTGEVVVRSLKTEGTHSEYTPIGHSTSLASRMQALAPTGSIATTEQTRRLCEGYFTFKPLGPTRIKGVSEPVNVVEVTGLGPLRTRLQAASQRGLTKFVGRQAELDQIKNAFELARAGHGQIVAAMGEPGVGKSRLVLEFKAIAQAGCLVLETFSVSHGKASAYLPVIDLLKNYFRITVEDDERARREKVAGKVVILDRALEDALPYLYSLLAISEGDDPLAQFDPQTRRQRTLQAVKRILTRESLNQPLIVVFEDLHWIDNETQALLNLLADSIANARILLLVNYRPEYHHQWGSKTCYTQLRLDPLGKDSAEQMLNALLSSDPGPLPGQGEGRGVGIAPVKRLILERTEGNPFFMEEMVQALFEQGVLVRNAAVELAKPIDKIRVPATVQAILAARIDRLPAPEKELLQTLAVLGREFSSELIRRVAGKPDDQLERMLSALQLGEFIYERPATGDIEYQFKHALTQEVAYTSVLTERRRSLHERTAQAIEALHAGRLEDHLPSLAHHYDRGGNARKAVEYLSRAGVRAAAQVAHSAAVGYFTRAVELLGQSPNNTDRTRTEFNLQMALSASLRVSHGNRSPEQEAALIRAQQLSEQLGDDALLAQALLAMAEFRTSNRQPGMAQSVLARVLELAESANAPVIIAEAHRVLGSVMYMTGQFEAARHHFELALKQPGHVLSGDQFVAVHGTLAGVMIYLGYPAAALEETRGAVAAARRLADPFTIALALSRAIIFHRGLRDSLTVLAQSEELLSIANEHGMPFYAAHAQYLRSKTLGWIGSEEAIGELRSAISALEDLGGAPMAGLYADLGEVCGRHGRVEEGLRAITDGEPYLERTGVRILEAELHRVKGELLLMKTPPDEPEGERSLRTAIDVARRQKAKWFELRATTSLSRLLKQQGKAEEARAMLSETYGWFTEGFEFTDLKDAKALLDELGS